MRKNVIGKEMFRNVSIVGTAVRLSQRLSDEIDVIEEVRGDE